MPLNPGLLTSSSGAIAVKVENANGVIINPETGFPITPYDSIVITYTDSTKATISTVQYKLSGVTVNTITLTQTSTTDTYTLT